MRKRRFYISNFKYSTGVFELAVLYFSTAYGSFPSTKSKLIDYPKSQELPKGSSFLVKSVLGLMPEQVE